MANNMIQIKRSLNTANPTSLANGELAFSSNGDILFIGANGVVEPIGGKRYPGTLTANQALVANSSSAIDKVIVANAVINRVWANGTHGTAGYVLTSGGSSDNAYWVSAGSLATSPGGSNTQIQYNDSGSLGGASGFTYDETSNNVTIANTLSVSGNVASSNLTTGTIVVTGGVGVSGRINTGDLAAGNDSVYSSLTGTTLTTANVHASATVNASVLSVGGWVIANQSGVFTSGVVNGDIVQVGTAFKANTTQVTIGSGIGFSANGGVGTAGQILYSNGTSAYWDAAPAGDITAVVAGEGLTGGATSGSATLDVGAGDGISVNATAVSVLPGSGGGLSANATGVWVIAGDGLSTNATGVHVGAGNGISVSADSIRVQQANGIYIDTGGVSVYGGSTLTVNNSGVHVNSALSITSLTLSGDVTVNGNTTLGDSSSDIITPTARFAGSLVPSANVTYDLGTSTLRWNDLYLAGDTIELGNVTIGDIGGALTSNLITANVTLKTQDLNVQGNSTIGSNGSDIVTINARVASDILPSANATYNFGNNTLRFNELHAVNVHSEYLYIDKDVQISGNLVVTGNVTTINVETLSVTDSLIQLATNNTISDLIDIGVYGNYQVSGGSHEHTGFFRDATDGNWKLFIGLTEAPTSTINTSGAGYSIGTLESYLISGGLVSNATHVAVTANSTVNVTITANTLTLTTALAATEGGTGYDTYTAGDILTAANSSTLSKLTLGTSGYVLQSNGSALVYDTIDGGTF